MYLVLIGGYLLCPVVLVSAIGHPESAMGVHMASLLNLPPTSLSLVL